jgi:predicted amidohydrolase YtcJ
MHVLSSQKNFLAMRSFGLLIFLVSVLLMGGCKGKPPADLVLYNANIYTVDSAMPRAGALVVTGGRIVFVGGNEEARQYIGQKTESIDCKGNFVMPGFMEGHGHLHGLGDFLRNLNLMHAKDWDEIVAQVGEAAAKAKPGEWIIGRGWHQEKWASKPAPNYLGYPYHEQLSKVSPDNPVILTHASGHAIFVNAKAMELAGITAATHSPEGGDIVKDAKGQVLGVFEETAMNLVRKVYNDFISMQPEDERKARWIKGIQLAEQECLKKGITSFADAGSSFEKVKWMRELAAKKQLQMRHWLMVRESNAALRANAGLFPVMNEGNGHLTVNAIKVSLDGALGSYGAWLLEPYADRPGFLGQNTFSMDSLRAIADFAWNHQMQLCVHSIGDRANRETINIFAEQVKHSPSRDHRWRVEHAQHVHPSEIQRFKEWKIIASMHGIHCTSDAPFVIKRLGNARAATSAYMWKAFLDAGVLVNNGTDVPVEDTDPVPNFYASVTRKLKDGTAFYPQQKMTRQQAIYAYTMANAIAQFQEKELGSLVKGKYADITMLSKDLIECTDAEIPDTRVLMTIVGGKIMVNKL